jgi:transcriptional regulator with XRE-family HTH domain
VSDLRALKAGVWVRAIVVRVAARVREERMRKHLTFDYVALSARVSRSSLIRFETGKSGIQLETLARLVVVGLGLEWAAFMSTTSPARRARAGHRSPVATLTKQEMEGIRRRMRGIMKILREAEGPDSAPDRA